MKIIKHIILFVICITFSSCFRISKNADEQSDKELILKYGVAKPDPSDVEIKLKVGEENSVEITGGSNQTIHRIKE